MNNGTHIAVFGEMMIFSLSGNSFHSFGSSTGTRSVVHVGKQTVQSKPALCLLFAPNLT